MEMLKGKRARWLSVVVRCPWHTEPPPTTIQIKAAGDATEESVDGSEARRSALSLVADSSSGWNAWTSSFARKPPRSSDRAEKKKKNRERGVRLEVPG